MILDKRHGAVGARSHPPAGVEPGGRIAFVPGHGNRGSRFQRKRHHARCPASLKFQLLGKRRDQHAHRRIAAFCWCAGIARIFRVRVGRAGHHLLRFSVPPGVGDHSVGCGKSAGRDGGMADAGFGGGVRKGRVAKPRAFIDQSFQAARPLAAEFVDVVAAHLVDNQEDHEFGTCEGGFGRCDGSGGLGRCGDGECRDRAKYQKRWTLQGAPSKGSTSVPGRGFPRIPSAHV
jgi:hypothetical protein